MAKNHLRILFPEGSSLSARQAITALGPRGYIIDVCDPDAFCICRFSRYTHKVHKTPAMNDNPVAYLEAIKQLLKEQPYDVMIPIHDNAYLFSKVYDEIAKSVRIPLADFQAFERVQSKTAFMRLLNELHLPHPRTKIVRTADELLKQDAFPFYVKTAFGTAGSGTWRIADASELIGVAQQLQQRKEIGGKAEVLVQAVAPGKLCVAQSLFNRGELLAVHCYEQEKIGIGGSASARRGVDHPTVKSHVMTIGKNLGWHGSLMVDYLYDEHTDCISYIEANPRPGETMNATLSNVNLVDLLVQLALKETVDPVRNPRYGVLTHSALAVLLGIADRSSSRWSILKETWQMTLRIGDYRNSQEDLTPIATDPLSMIPLFAVLTALLKQPSKGHALAAKAVHSYSLDRRAVAIIHSDL